MSITITKDHWIKDAKREPIAGGNAMPTRRCLVIHFTNGKSALSTINNWWRTPAAKGACAHVIIDRDGTIYQCRPFNRTAGHAGVSRWQDPNTGKMYGSANAYGIGIELANAGDDKEIVKWAKAQGFPAIKAKHRNGGKLVEWEDYPEPLLESLRELSIALVERYNLDDVTGHDFISPGRKNDPGPLLPFEDIREGCGFGLTLPKTHWP